MRGFIDVVIALAFALLPRRRWDSVDLPIQNIVLASSLLTCLGGAALGITGFFAYTAHVHNASDRRVPHASAAKARMSPTVVTTADGPG